MSKPTPTVPDYAAVTDWCRAAQRPLLVSHRRPDGDALGALLGAAGALRQLGADPRIALFEPLPDRYHFWESAADWRMWKSPRPAWIDEIDRLVIVDTCSRQQLDLLADYLAQAPPTLVLDHHATRDDIATRPDDLCIIDPTAGAASLLVAEWVRTAGLALDRLMADALLVGIATDCGWYRFSNTDARMLRASAELVEAGADANRLYALIHEQEPAAKMRLLGRLLENMELLADDRLAVLRLRPADFAAAGANPSMTDELVNAPARIATVVVTVLCTQQADGAIRVNFRSKHSVDVAALAARYGGGGHARAAGARLAGDFESAVAEVVAATRAVLPPA